MDPDAIQLSFVLPARDALQPSMRLAVLGSVCDGVRVTAGDPWPQARCEGGGTAHQMSLEIDVANGAPNHNPRLSASPSQISLDGLAWEDPGPVRELPADCAAIAESAAIPRITAASAHRIALVTRDEDREPLPPNSFGGPSRESLLLSHAATAGELERPWSTVSGDGPADVNVGFTAPTSAPGTGLLARLYFVVRDMRGGADFAVRAACVIP
jgi:hypothetical protein